MTVVRAGLFPKILPTVREQDLDVGVAIPDQPHRDFGTLDGRHGTGDRQQNIDVPIITTIMMIMIIIRILLHLFLIHIWFFFATVGATGVPTLEGAVLPKLGEEEYEESMKRISNLESYLAPFSFLLFRFCRSVVSIAHRIRLQVAGNTVEGLEAVEGWRLKVEDG